MNMFIMFGICLAIYTAVLLAVGWYFSKRQKSVVDFWLGGRKLGFIPIGFSAGATWITGGGILAVTAFYLVGGLGSVWTFAAPNFMALFIIGLLVSKIKSLPAITQPELLEQRYASSIRLPVAILVAIIMMLFGAADVSGLMLIFGVLFGLDPIYAALLISLSVSAYVLLGGMSAVVWTDIFQYLLLASVTIFLAIAVIFVAADTSALSVSGFIASSQSGTGWWNPFSIGLPLVLIFLVAIIPGWISEQDQWQKVWASKDEKSARKGFFLGSFLVFLIFGVACCLLGLGLRYLYPDITTIGDAEIALLLFSLNQFSEIGIVLIALGLTAAAMSCMDSFATSGGSTLSRDIYQRYVKPDATMKELKVVNKIAVLIIIAGSTAIAFTDVNIIEYIHIATFLASAAYFFPLMAGLFWSRATKEGAIASLIIGGVCQISFTLIDMYVGKNAAGLYYLELISPILTGHGVIVSMFLSASALVIVSLMTKRSSVYNLAPFFEKEAKTLETDEVSKVDQTSGDYASYYSVLHAEINGEREHLQLDLKASKSLDWDNFIADLRAKNTAWFTSSGTNTVYRLTHGDLLSCPVISRGNNEQEVWIAAEPRLEKTDLARVEVYLAFKEIAETLRSMGITVDFIKPEDRKAI
ncbi:MAG: sodium:solute symporter family protein [Methanosarcinales archaeon]|jgi:SSS family solute:Na+ symporter|nr:sodium:solute symporter family protein [Methanosarcinales archaeon]